MPSDSAAGQPLESYSWKQIRNRPSAPTSIFRTVSPLGASTNEIDVPRALYPSLVSTSRAGRSASAFGMGGRRSFVFGSAATELTPAI